MKKLQRVEKLKLASKISGKMPLFLGHVNFPFDSVLQGGTYKTPNKLGCYILSFHDFSLFGNKITPNKEKIS